MFHDVLVVLGCLVFFAVVTLGSYHAGRFEYALDEDKLVLTLRWLGTRRSRTIKLTSVTSVRHLSSPWDLVPIGKFPSLWGKLRPSNMVVIEREGKRILPVIVTPDDPEAFIDTLLAHIGHERK